MVHDVFQGVQTVLRTRSCTMLPANLFAMFLSFWYSEEYMLWFCMAYVTYVQLYNPGPSKFMWGSEPKQAIMA